MRWESWNRRAAAEMVYTFVICFIAGIGAGLGTGFAGMSAAAVILSLIHISCG